jgi:hypothetical protein
MNSNNYKYRNVYCEAHRIIMVDPAGAGNSNGNPIWRFACDDGMVYQPSSEHLTTEPKEDWWFIQYHDSPIWNCETVSNEEFETHAQEI